MDMSEPERLNVKLRGDFRHDEPMAKHVSWRAGGRARHFFQPADVGDLSAFLQSLPPEEPILFVGLGSNLLVRDGGFAGTVVFTHRALTGIAREAGAPAQASAESVFAAAAGVPAPHLARFVARHGAEGAEWMVGVPGTIGGALAMNAGCYGGETWNHVIDVETIDRAGTVRRRVPADYQLGYRHVELKSRAEEWFVSGRFAFPLGNQARAMARMRSLLAQRVASQPLDQPNAGSVFRNPPGDHAARLIESCGLKGYAIGAAQVSLRHANFIVNLGGARASDIEALVHHIQSQVLLKTGVALTPEVRIVGEAL